MRVVVQQSALATTAIQHLILAFLCFALLPALKALLAFVLLALSFLLSFALFDEMLLIFWHPISIHFVAELIKGVNHAFKLEEHWALEVGELLVRDV